MIPKRLTPRHFVIKIPKVKEVLKVAREKPLVTCRGNRTPHPHKTVSMFFSTNIAGQKGDSRIHSKY